jgi:hypothetical protein
MNENGSRSMDMQGWNTTGNIISHSELQDEMT